jgi:hypothetical protein
MISPKDGVGLRVGKEPVGEICPEQAVPLLYWGGGGIADTQPTELRGQGVDAEWRPLLLPGHQLVGDQRAAVYLPIIYHHNKLGFRIRIQLIRIRIQPF